MPSSMRSLSVTASAYCVSEHFCAAVGGDAEHLIVERVFNAYGNIDAARHHDFSLRLRCPPAWRPCMRAQAPPGAQEHAAEIASDHANHIGEPRMLQRFKRWHAGGFLVARRRLSSAHGQLRLRHPRAARKRTHCGAAMRLATRISSRNASASSSVSTCARLAMKRLFFSSISATARPSMVV